MRMSRALPAALVAGAFTVASLFVAAPASAATLPNGQKITVVDTNDWQFSDSSTTGALTPVGTPGVLPLGEYVEAVDVDDDGYGYAFSTTWVEELPETPDDCTEEDPRPECFPFPIEYADGATLYVADANTGVLSSPIPVQIQTGPLDEIIWADADSCFAIDYTGGVITAVCNIYGNGDNIEDSAWIGTMDPDTGRLYPEVLLYGEDFIEFQAIAKSPIDGVIWGFDLWDVFTITLDGDLPDYVGSVDMTIWGADFDRDGKLWASAYYPDIPARIIEPGEEGLVLLDLDTGDFTVNEVWSDPTAVINALTVWGKATLPATGPSGSPLIAAAAAGLLMLGALLAAGAMLRRRVTEH